MSARFLFPFRSGVVAAHLLPASPCLQNTTTLSWDTFSAAAAEAGISRRLGGIHYLEGDLWARAMGRKVGCVVWQKA